MICPFINDACVEANCTMWLNNQCAIISIIRKFSPESTSPSHPIDHEPKTILAACSGALKRTGIASLSRHEIDDYLASSNTVLNASERRALLRTLRDIRRVNRERRKGTGTEWRNRSSNQGSAWSTDEDEDIKQSVANGQSIEQIAAKHKRSEIAVQYRMERFGYIKQ